MNLNALESPDQGLEITILHWYWRNCEFFNGRIIVEIILPFFLLSVHFPVMWLDGSSTQNLLPATAVISTCHSHVHVSTTEPLTVTWQLVWSWHWLRQHQFTTYSSMHRI